MSLNETPHSMQWPETHYIFIEKIGPFSQTAHVAWTEVHKLVQAISEHNRITGYMSLYKTGPEIYRAGVALAAPPVHLPVGLRYEKFPGGKNAAGIAAPYAPNAAIFDLSPPLAHPGVTVERKQPWLDTWDTGIDLESRDLKITVAGNHAFAWGYQRMTGTPRAAGRPVSFWMRVTYALERIAGAWRIVHQHDSVPFYMDGSLRPAFDLQP